VLLVCGFGACTRRTESSAAWASPTVAPKFVFFACMWVVHVFFSLCLNLISLDVSAPLCVVDKISCVPECAGELSIAMTITSADTRSSSVY
jgi:hypothetical protein